MGSSPEWYTKLEVRTCCSSLGKKWTWVVGVAGNPSDDDALRGCCRVHRVLYIQYGTLSCKRA